MKDDSVVKIEEPNYLRMIEKEIWIDSQVDHSNLRKTIV